MNQKSVYISIILIFNAIRAREEKKWVEVEFELPQIDAIIEEKKKINDFFAKVQKLNDCFNIELDKDGGDLKKNGLCKGDVDNLVADVDKLDFSKYKINPSYKIKNDIIESFRQCQKSQRKNCPLNIESLNKVKNHKSIFSGYQKDIYFEYIIGTANIEIISDRFGDTNQEELLRSNIIKKLSCKIYNKSSNEAEITTKLLKLEKKFREPYLTSQEHKLPLIMKKLTENPLKFFKRKETFEFPPNLGKEFDKLEANPGKYDHCDLFLNTPGREAMQIYPKSKFFGIF